MTNADDRPRATGGCLCGAVRYEVRGDLRDVVNCHCGQCRRVTGHHGAFTAAADADLVVTEDRGLRWYDSSATARRGFCGVCGSTLFWKAQARDYTAITAGSIDPPTGLTTVGHIFTADKGDYYAIADDLWQRPQGHG